MPAGLATRARKCKDLENQMFFSFAENHKPITKRAKQKKHKSARRVLKMPTLAPPPEQTAPDWRIESLKDISALMQKLAAKYVPRNAFEDFDCLIQGTKLLQELQAAVTVTEHLQAPLAEYNSAVVTHAPQYRLLRNRAFAALATLADLSTKPPSKGSPDYQKGMRDGFNHASDVAIFFLDDLETAFQFRR